MGELGKEVNSFIRQFANSLIASWQIMSQKSEKSGVVVSNKMQKSIVVAVEWQVRHGLYGKTERRTSKFMVHDEENAAKVGDTVAITETRPLSRRKRWALKRVVRQAAQV